MSTNKIKIDHVTGGKDKDELKNCYFEPSTEDPGGYDFYDKNGNRMARDLNVGEPFEFNMNGLTWVIYDWTCDNQHAQGNWRIDGTVVDPALDEGGTFSAQAGGGVDGETDDPGRILPLEQIRIFEVVEDGVGPVKNALLNCFFSPEGPAGVYMFFKPNGQKLHGQIHGGEKIKVEVDGQTWELTTHFHPHSETAHGHWKLKKPGAGEEDQGGTFSAQAGGGLTAASVYA